MLTDVEYVVLHANVDVEDPEAFQFYIKHIDGSPLNYEAGNKWVIQCLKAAIKRGFLRVGLLSKVTRIFRKHDIMVTTAEANTRGDKTVNTLRSQDFFLIKYII